METTGATTTRVQALVADLTEDLLFAVSRGSKELFHSDLLAWFAEHEPAVTRALLDLWAPGTAGGHVRAYRELRRLDLVLAEDDPAGAGTLAVVENKMFALPDTDQLRRYGHEVDRLPGSPVLILLGLADPGWPDGRWFDGDGHEWRYCSYAALAAALGELDLPASTDPFAVMTLSRWVEMLEKTSGLAALVGDPHPDHALMLDRPICEALGALNIPVQKLRAYAVATRIRAMVGDASGEVRINATATHGVGLVEAFVPVADGVEAGWQLQGEHWRVAVRVRPGHPLHGRDDAARRGRFAMVEDSGWTDLLRDGAFAGRPIVPEPAGPESFNRFDPDFVYRYVSVPGITVGQAVSEGVRIIDAARSSDRFR
ncbi:PD-(D/E)XK nuclease family protein [Tomitella gaofuii]|uniref:PD-(D/E)XK nuclease family protein n=1 Tax=Tomitella gaofuii TaxID=2760083 RepID=UPI0015F93B52|nr:PD-(D/E)XK nuclease family protein [Tomitella gaofuii]